jgi:hypothetical protein
VKPQYLTVAEPVQLTHEGAVNLRVREIDGENSVLELGVDYEKAEIPSRAYAADYCQIIKTQTEYVIVFGKLAPGTKKLRNKVEISFQRYAFGHQLWASSRDLHKALHQSKYAQLLDLTGVEETDIVQSFRSNNAFMAGLGEEALVDFYYIPPNEIEYVRRGKRRKITLDPVLRVVMSVSLLGSFLNQIDGLVTGEPEWVAIIKSDLELK